MATEDSEILILLAKAMMHAEIERHTRSLEEALCVRSETNRTYLRLLASKEADRLFELMEEYGFLDAVISRRALAQEAGK